VRALATVIKLTFLFAFTNARDAPGTFAVPTAATAHPQEAQNQVQVACAVSAVGSPTRQLRLGATRTTHPSTQAPTASLGCGFQDPPWGTRFVLTSKPFKNDSLRKKYLWDHMG
jgi:hypothetical protein